ncbi:MAG: hypothetical protein AAFQ87_27300, partial [Bacteroidota bacterium]
MNSVMGRLVLLIGLLVLSLAVFGQNEKSFADWKAEIMEANALSTDSAIERLSALSLATESEFPALSAFALSAKGKHLFKSGDPHSSYELLTSNLPLAKEALNDWELASLQYYIYRYQMRFLQDSLSLQVLTDFREYISQLETSDTLAKQNMYWRLGFTQGNYETYYGRNAEALDYLYDLVQLSDEEVSRYARFRHLATYNIGVIYMQLQEFDKAGDFFQQTIDHAQQYDNKEALNLTARSIHYVGIIYEIDGDIEKWEEYTRRAIEAFRELDTEQVIPSLIDLATHYIETDKLAKAEAYVAQVENTLEQYQVDNHFLLYSSYSLFGKLAFAKGDPTKALQWAEKAYEADKAAQSHTAILLEKQEYAAALGDYRLAHESLLEYLDLYETGMNEKQRDAIAELEKNHTIAEKEREAAFLLKTKNLQDKQ